MGQDLLKKKKLFMAIQFLNAGDLGKKSCKNRSISLTVK